MYITHCNCITCATGIGSSSSIKDDNCSWCSKPGAELLVDSPGIDSIASPSNIPGVQAGSYHQNLGAIASSEAAGDHHRSLAVTTACTCASGATGASPSTCTGGPGVHPVHLGMRAGPQSCSRIEVTPESVGCVQCSYPCSTQLVRVAASSVSRIGQRRVGWNPSASGPESEFTLCGFRRISRPRGPGCHQHTRPHIAA